MPPASEFFACGNGLLHLPTGDLYPPTPNYFGVSASEVQFNPEAPEPRGWLTFLAELWGFEDGYDQQVVDALQEISGYVLSADTSQQKIMLIVGPRRSGKGTIARILKKLLGSTSVAGPTIASLAGNFGLEPLITKPLAFIGDLRIGQRTDKSAIVEHLLKISGEDQQTVDRKNKLAWHGQLKTRIIILTNDLPSLSDGSGALAGRYLILVMTKSFYDKEDPALTDKLSTELSGILNWAIEGYRRLRERGYFIQPESSKASVEIIEMLGAPVKAFIRDRCRIGPGLAVPVDELWMEWKNWCEQQAR